MKMNAFKKMLALMLSLAMVIGCLALMTPQTAKAGGEDFNENFDVRHLKDECCKDINGDNVLAGTTHVVQVTGDAATLKNAKSIELVSYMADSVTITKTSDRTKFKVVFKESADGKDSYKISVFAKIDSITSMALYFTVFKDAIYEVPALKPIIVKTGGTAAVPTLYLNKVTADNPKGTKEAIEDVTWTAPYTESENKITLTDGQITAGQPGQYNINAINVKGLNISWNVIVTGDNKLKTGKTVKLAASTQDVMTFKASKGTYSFRTKTGYVNIYDAKGKMVYSTGVKSGKGYEYNTYKLAKKTYYVLFKNSASTSATLRVTKK